VEDVLAVAEFDDLEPEFVISIAATIIAKATPPITIIIGLTFAPAGGADGALNTGSE